MNIMNDYKKANLKKSICLRWRRHKNLCNRCGRDLHEGECIEDYSETDLRSVPLSVKEPDIDFDFEKKRNTILSYRRKKGLCERCGIENDHDQKCEENWEKSDNRTEDEKLIRPAIIETPKLKNPTILEKIILKNEIQLSVTPSKKIYLHRNYIVINLSKSDKGNIIEYSCINQLSKKFQNHILVFIGKIDKHFPYSDAMRIRKMSNILEIVPLTDQNIADHIFSCSKFFSFPCKTYIPICIKYDIPYYEFHMNRNATNFLPDIAYQI